MASERGTVSELFEACITIRFDQQNSLACVIDTGFSGALMLPRSFIAQLQAQQIGTEFFTLAGGQEIESEIFVLSIIWLGKQKLINVVASNAEDALIGTELLQNSVLHIDYVTSKVEIKNEKEI